MPQAASSQLRRTDECGFVDFRVLRPLPGNQAAPLPRCPAATSAVSHFKKCCADVGRGQASDSNDNVMCAAHCANVASRSSRSSSRHNHWTGRRCYVNAKDKGALRPNVKMAARRLGNGCGCGGCGYG
ncbi:hypothetical protein AWZ03_004335 [Drosophila navojoa]|uniref:Uncharacterized protein n=1 Tax=Drosophila navojoa TaxID=7232 RepID=A0A484BK56_DRONA|nr:hypothetical protein AWZ03_004335 [Drosophila navojoa]